MEEKNSNGKGFAVTSLVMGILSIVFLPFIVISVGMGLLALIFGIIAKNKGEKSLSKAGISLGVVSLVITLLLFLFLEVFEASLFVIPSWYK